MSLLPRLISATLRHATVLARSPRRRAARRASLVLALFGSFAVASAQTEPLRLSPIADGPFQPTWESLAAYQTPEWFRDAKFGIWAHWGPQCQPEDGDWYARNLYVQGTAQHQSHLAAYGHPSTHGFKDVIHAWKAERFDPDSLLKFYKENGARYFMALANHHDNFDLYDSTFQPWNSVNVGPKKDLVAGWAKAARDNGLRFAVSVHAARAWTWYEVAQGADKDGPLAGVPYDGKLTRADGKGLWWEGLDPQDLYEQNHRPGKTLNHNFDAARGTSLPDNAYLEKFFNRTKQLWDDYHPDQIYYDDRVLPFYDIAEEVPLKLAAHFYNTRLDEHGRTQAVMNGKHFDEMQRRTMVYDIERGKAHDILPQPWQTDTCIGGWHYSRGIYDRKGYKSAASVIQMLADIVSKNGNLMLSVPLRRDGRPDEQEVEIIQRIGAWLKVNGEAIYATRPWKVYGEGPSTAFSDEGRHGGQADVSKKPYTAEDIRYTTSKDGRTLYAIVCGRPAGPVALKSLGQTRALLDRPVASIEQLGAAEAVVWSRGPDALTLTPSFAQPVSDAAVAFKITLK